MKRLIRLLLLSLPIVTAAQSQLPPCPATGYKHNCFGTSTFGDQTYVGEFRDDKPNGRGTRTFANGAIYVGEEKNGLKHGQGTITFADGEKYVGEYKDDKTNGRGIRTFPSGAVYVGEEKDNKRHGLGTYTWANREKYVGEWSDGLQNGQGIEYRANGSIKRSGRWAAGQLVQSFALDQSRFPFNAPTQPIVAAAQSQLPPCPATGYKHNCFGTVTYRSGDQYVGEFKDDKRNGQGTLTSPNGGKYVGEFKDGQFDGEGTYDWGDGNKYVGEFRDSKTNGRGIRTFPNGAVYVGEEKDGKKHGLGTFTWADREKYVGEWSDDLQNGQGIEYRANGSIKRSGRWAAGQLVQSFALDQSRFPFNAPNQTASVRPSSAPVTPIAEPPRSTLNLAVTASPPDLSGVLTLNITTHSDTASLRVNGDEIGGRADGRYSVNRFAQIGDNNFEVIATDRFGNTQKQTIAVSRRAADNTVRFASLNPIAVRARPATNAVAIIIGIQDYRRVSKAEFASNDARVFYDYAVRGLGVRPENIKLLVDQEADAIEILSAFNNWLPLKTRKGQTDVYVFFSGHGLPSDDGSNLYMLPHGVDRQFLDRTAIKQSELIASLQAVSPRSVTMFMDACYSGQSRTGETLLASARPIAIQAKASSFPPNFNVITASAPDQLASSSPDLRHGIFSYYLMKGMEGEADENKDGNITMAEMQSYLKEYVGKKAMSLSRTQVPQLTGDQSRVLVSK